MRAAHVGLGVGAGVGLWGLVLKARGREQLGNLVLGAGVVTMVGSGAALMLDEGDFAGMPAPKRRAFPRARRHADF